MLPALVLLVVFVLGWACGHTVTSWRWEHRHARLQAKFKEARQQLDASARAVRTQKSRAKAARRQLRAVGAAPVVPLAHADGGRRAD